MTGLGSRFTTSVLRRISIGNTGTGTRFMGGPGATLVDGAGTFGQSSLNSAFKPRGSVSV